MQATFQVAEHHVRGVELAENFSERLRGIGDVHQIDVTGQNQLVRQDSSPATTLEIIEEPGEDVNGGLADPRIQARIGSWIAVMGGTMLAGSSADFEQAIVEEADKWAR
jgi:hypothetical protein